MQTEANTVDFEPGTGRALAYGWQRMKANALLFLLAAFVAIVIDIPMQGNTMEFGGEGTDALYALLFFAYALLFHPVVDYGISFIFLKGVRGDQVQIRSVFDGFKNYVNIILASLLVFGLVIIGLIVFIVPGIYVACRLAFVSYLVMDEGLDPVAAVEASWRLTKGHAFKIFLLGVTCIFLFFGGLLLLLVGVLPAIMWACSSFAALYLSISHDSEPMVEHPTATEDLVEEA